MIRCFSFQGGFSVATPSVTTEMPSGKASGSMDHQHQWNKSQHENSVTTVSGAYTDKLKPYI